MTNNGTMYTKAIEKLNFEQNLGGTVKSFYKKLSAERVTKSLMNVRAIANEITASKNIQAIIKNAIKKLFGIKPIINSIEAKPIIVIDSSEVKSQINKELEWRVRIDANKIKVTTETETADRSVAGVEKVDNQLTIDW
jgi:osmotically-inducible protein OsmY